MRSSPAQRLAAILLACLLLPFSAQASYGNVQLFPGDKVAYGTLPNGNPLYWFVLEVTNAHLLLVTENAVLKGVPFHYSPDGAPRSNRIARQWENSVIRHWLNTDSDVQLTNDMTEPGFQTYFTDAEWLAMIPQAFPGAFEPLDDRAFLLTREDVENPDYQQAPGALDVKYYWWLRSNDGAEDSAQVDAWGNGFFYENMAATSAARYNGYYIIAELCVRPAIQISVASLDQAKYRQGILQPSGTDAAQSYDPNDTSSQRTAEIRVGKSVDLHTWLPTDNMQTWTDYTTSWRSDNEKVAKVGDTGLVYGVSPGIATITVSSSLSYRPVICQVTVVGNPPFTQRTAKTPPSFDDYQELLEDAGCGLSAFTGYDGVGDNCTFYAWARAAEILDELDLDGIPGTMFTGNAGTWYAQNKTWITSGAGGYKYSANTPKPGAFAVWGASNGGVGHVAVVEAVEDGQITLSEANYGYFDTAKKKHVGNYAYKVLTLTHKEMSRNGDFGPFLGYIYFGEPYAL
ncbi:CHAP domain-containing protein [Eubacteriales bacterium OttesenSCG-928-A19]|nr:CHAP domain-containing protein [Eubacteriales bacterium OttesenSCG-928-A19]